MINKIKEVLEKYKDHTPVKVTAELLAVIEEKCTWKWRIENGKKVFRNCLYLTDDRIAYPFKYCPYCGKIREEVPDSEKLHGSTRAQ